jgi:transcription-repair coupling factor (superfamily II helicase)
VEGSAYLPDSYIPDASQKLHLYRRLSRIEQVTEAHALAAEVRDRYGPPPDEVERLIAAAALRLLGTKLGVERITIQREAARVTFREGVVARLASLQTALRSHQVELEIKRTTPLSFVLRRRGGTGIIEIVASALEGLIHSQSPVSAVF